jgi:stage III sporulation protein AH
MINKQSLWFLTLFSLILVLSVYYVTMPSELLFSNNGKIDNKTNDKVTIKESELLTALRVENEDQRINMIKELKLILTNVEASIDDKNNAYEQLKLLDVLKGKEETLEGKLKKLYELNSFIKIDNNQVRVVVAGEKHDVKLANNIMRSIQEEFDSKVYVSVKFQP